MLIDFFNGEEMEAICLTGIQHVVSISLGPTSESLSHVTTAEASTSTASDSLPSVHIRLFTLKLLASGSRVPRVELVPMGPSLDLSLRRSQAADPVIWKEAMKRPKMKKSDIAKGLGTKRKNLEVDEMGDLRGRVHVAKQNLDKLQTRKMKGLKDLEERVRKRRKTTEGGGDEDGMDVDDS
jgi:ribosome production factor 2